MSADVPNAFMQIEIDHKVQEKIIIKIRGALVVDKLLKTDCKLYKQCVVYENGDKIL